MPRVRACPRWARRLGGARECTRHDAGGGGTMLAGPASSATQAAWPVATCGGWRVNHTMRGGVNTPGPTPCAVQQACAHRQQVSEFGFTRGHARARSLQTGAAPVPCMHIVLYVTFRGEITSAKLAMLPHSVARKHNQSGRCGQQDGSPTGSSAPSSSSSGSSRGPPSVAAGVSTRGPASQGAHPRTTAEKCPGEYLGSSMRGSLSAVRIRYAACAYRKNTG